MVSRIFSTLFFTIVYVFKFSFYLTKKTINLAKFSFNNKFIRTLIVLLVLDTIFSIGIILISTIYFLYLIYNYMDYKGIFDIINKELFLKLSEIKSKHKILTVIEKLNCNKIVLNNILLEDDNGIVKINYLIITEKAIFNLIPLSSTEELLLSDFKYNKLQSNKKVLELNSINELLNNVLPIQLPKVNIFITQNTNFTLHLNENNSINLIPLEMLESLFINSGNRTYKIPLEEVKALITENKLWVLDKIFILLNTLFTKYTMLTLFVLSIPLTYICYIFIVLYLNNIIHYLLNIASNFI